MTLALMRCEFVDVILFYDYYYYYFFLSSVVFLTLFL